MSVLIKGMEMPKSCLYCNFRVFGYCIAHKQNCYTGRGAELPNGRQEWCPLVEVPTPHGRLIDAVAITDNEDVIHKRMIFGGQTVYTQSAIDNEPTVIEAEE